MLLPPIYFVLCKRRTTWFWADCRLVISIVLCLPVFIPDLPWHGNTPDGHGFGLIGISPPRGTHGTALIGCDGSRQNKKKPLQRSACDWTEVPLYPLPVIAFGADAPHRLIHEPGNLPSFFCGVKKFPSPMLHRSKSSHPGIPAAAHTPEE